jgi:cell division septal protein FtsQ
MKLPVRQPVARGTRRRTQRIGPAWPARLLGLVLVVASAGAAYWLTVAAPFRLDPTRVRVSGLVYTDEQQLRNDLGLTADARPNVFRLRVSALADTLRALPSVGSAEIAVSLPDQLDIVVHERQPLLVWRTPQASYLVDASGALFAAAPPSAATMPTVVDLRSTASQIVVGGRLDEVDLAAARLLLTITPADLGSAAGTLSLSLDDDNGWYMDAAPQSWRAVFGFYSAIELPPAERIPRQRQCLASLLAQRHEQADVIYLAIAGDSCGTFREQPTPSARAVQNVWQRAL